MKTLNDQYKLIKEGKGHKGVFLTEAKKQFPNYIRNAANFEEVTHILKDKGVINENIVGLEVINSPFLHKEKESYEKAFSKFLEEAKKETKTGAKAEEKEVSKQVTDIQTKIHDRKDTTNIDNLSYDQVMMGYYAELKDPKNCKKTMEELKAIVLKNVAKDPLYYTKDGQFGVKGLGYTTEAPGLGEPKEPKGPYKSSGYGTLKENKIRKVINTLIKEELNESDLSRYDDMSDYEVMQWAEDEGAEEMIVRDGEGGLANREEVLNSILGLDTPNSRDERRDDDGMWDGSEQDPSGGYGPSSHLQESKLRKVVNNIVKQQLQENLDKRLKEIEAESQLEAMGSKLEKIMAEIEKRNMQLSKLDEDEDLAAMMDKKATGKIKKEIKLLEKAKKKAEKILDKQAKKNTKLSPSTEIIDEDGIDEAESDKEDTDKIKTDLEDIKKSSDEISKIELFEETPTEEQLSNMKSELDSFVDKVGNASEAVAMYLVNHPEDEGYRTQLMQLADPLF